MEKPIFRRPFQQRADARPSRPAGGAARSLSSACADEFLDGLLESLDAGVMACDADGTLSLFNRATREMHAVGEEQLRRDGRPVLSDLFMADGTTPMATDDVPLFRALRGELVRDVEMVIAPKNGSPRRVLCNGQAIETRDGRTLGAVVAMHDVTERRRAEEQLSHLALHDSLTGLPNRVLLLERLAHALALAPHNDSNVVVLFADLDHLKLVNDGLGRRAGDELLAAVAHRLSETMLIADAVDPLDPRTVARHGGDQFVVLCEVYTREQGAIRLAERLTETLAAPFLLAGEEVLTSASIGIAISDESSSPDSMLRDAETAMQRAKTRGRGRYELFDETLHTRFADGLQREKALRYAIEQDQLRLHYQPIVSLRDHRIVAVEALVRWEHPERGLLAPSEFIELAEDSGLIIALGEWVLREGCRQIASWEQDLGADFAPQVSVNISARQLAHPEIAMSVSRGLEEAGAEPARLALEITETVLMEDGGAPVATLQTLKRLGGQVMLDDFGTGYSSLSYLGRLPVDTLKLDRSFVAPLGLGGEGRAIAAAVLELARALGMRIVAEGVETQEQLAALEELGCDLAQGYLFARALPADEMTTMLDAQAAGQNPWSGRAAQDGELGERLYERWLAARARSESSSGRRTGPFANFVNHR